MTKNNKLMLYYGFQECEDGIYHAFSLEDMKNLPDDSNVADELAGLLDTVPEDERFNWNCMEVQIPDSVIERIWQEATEAAINAMRQKIKKEYTIESFKKGSFYKEIKAFGYFSQTSSVESALNYSSILTKLIQTAGRLVDSYASDLAISWKSIMNDLHNASDAVLNPKTDENGELIEAPGVFRKSYLFGFRDMGVDDTTFVLNKYNSADVYSNQYGAAYREIWRLDVIVTRAACKAEMSLYQVNKVV